METFVVRVFAAAEPGQARGQLRGLVEHVGSGSRSAFAGASELVALLEARLAANERREER